MRSYRNYCLALGLPIFVTLWQRTDANLNFAVVGNWGFKDQQAEQSASYLKKTSENDHYSFIVSPGSNFIGGVNDDKDSSWREDFENLFGDDSGRLKLPFFTVLGGEDWAGDVTCQVTRTGDAYESEMKSQPSVSLEVLPSTKISTSGDINVLAIEKDTDTPVKGLNIPKWTLPNWWYHYVRHFTTSGGMNVFGSGKKDLAVGLFFIDTFMISPSFPFSDMTSLHREHLEQFLEHGRRIFDYIIVVGDKPIHRPYGGGDIVLRKYLDTLFEEAQVDLYIAGRDHVLESIDQDETLHMECGSFSRGSLLGGILGSPVESGKITSFATGQSGFCGVELTAEEMIVRFFSGTDGALLRSITKPRKIRKQRDRLSPYSHFSKLPLVKFIPLPAQFFPSGDSVDFVRVVGTIGLILVFGMLILGGLTISSRSMK